MLIFIGVGCPVYSQAVHAGRYLDMGAVEYGKGNYKEAIVLFQKCVAQCQKAGAEKILGRAYNNIGNASSQMGQSEFALKNYHLALNISKAINDSLTIAKTTKNIGALYEEQRDFGPAMNYYQSALILSKKINNQPLMADCLNNMGIVYEQQFNYPKALEAYQRAFGIYNAEEDQERISMTLNNLAIVYKYQKDYSNSIQKYNEALALATKLDNKFMVAATQNNLGNVFALTGNYKKSLALCQLANQNARAIKAQEIIVESYDGIATAHEKLYNLSAALAFRKLYEKEKASFINTDRSGQLAEMQVKYETEIKEGEIKSLTQESKIRKLKINEQELQIQKRNYTILAFLLLLAVLAVAAYLWHRQHQLKMQLETEKTIRETEEQERVRIAKDIHDDLGSGLSKINFLSEIIFQKTEQLPEIRSSSESVKETAAKMIENMRDLIWVLNSENTTLANLIARIREYTTDYLEDFPIELHYSFPEKLQQTPITKESHRELFMVVKETLNNIAKHAQSTAVNLTVIFNSEELILTIRDNGIGFDQQKNATGNGLNNMKSRLKAIGGKCTISSEKDQGTIVEVIVPLQKIYKATSAVIKQKS